MNQRRAIFLAVLAIGLASVLVACSGGSDSESSSSTIPTDAELAAGPLQTRLVTSPESIGPGQQRLVFQLRRDEVKMGGPDLRATIEFDTLGIQPFDVGATWVWGDEDLGNGAYVTTVDLPEAGTWLATMTVAGTAGETAEFVVNANTPMPRTGETAPLTDSDTLASASLAEITTDPDPDNRFYETSVRDGISAGQASVVVFSTPKYCTTDVCGPILNMVKPAIDVRPDVNFVHVEVYEDFVEAGNQLIPRLAVLEWGIQSEPWVFTVDSGGQIVDSFEGVLSPSELDDALAALN